MAVCISFSSLPFACNIYSCASRVSIAAKSITPIFCNCIRECDLVLKCRQGEPNRTITNALKFLVEHNVSALKSIRFQDDAGSRYSSLYALLVALVAQQHNLQHLSIQHRGAAIPNQASFLKSISGSPDIASLKSLSINCLKHVSAVSTFLRRTPNLLELSLGNLSAGLALLPDLVPKLRVLHLGEVDADFAALEPLSRLRNLEQITLAQSVELESLDTVLQRLPVALAVNLVFAFGADFTWQHRQCFLSEALGRGRHDVARRLIQLGAQVGRLGDMNLRVWRKPPIHRAIAAGDESSLKLLLEAGASLVFEYGDLTPLCYAINHNPCLVPLLLEKALANLEENYSVFFLPDTSGTIYEFAAKSENGTVALQHCLRIRPKFLDVNSPNFFGFPPLAYCHSENHVDLLLENGADPNFRVGSFPTLLESMLCNDRRIRPAANEANSLVVSAKCRSRLNGVDSTAIDRIFDFELTAASKGKDSIIQGRLAPLLSYLFEYYPTDKLEALLQRTDFWRLLCLRSFPDGLELVLLVARRIPLSFDEYQRELIQRSILEQSAHNWKANILALLAAQPSHPSLALLRLAQCLRSRFAYFEDNLEVVMHLLCTYSVTEAALTETLNFVVQEYDITQVEMVKLVIKLIEGGARTVAKDESTSLLISLSKDSENARTVVRIAEAVPAQSKLTFVAANGDSVLKIAEASAKEGNFEFAMMLKLAELVSRFERTSLL